MSFHLELSFQVELTYLGGLCESQTCLALQIRQHPKNQSWKNKYNPAWKMGPETSTMPKQGHIPVIPLHIYVASSNVRNYINIIQNTCTIWNIVANQYPIGSMYGIFTYIYHQKQPNVGKYTIHGSYGYFHIHVTHLPSCYTYNTCVSYLPYGSNLPSPRPRSFIFHSLCNAWLFDSWCCWKAGGNILACIHIVYMYTMNICI